MNLLFGEPERSTLWALHVESGVVLDSLSEANDQVVFRIPCRPGLRGGEKTRGRETVTIQRREDCRDAVGSAEVWIGFDRSLLAGMMESFRPGLGEGLREMVFGHGEVAPFALPTPTTIFSRLVPALLEPPVAGPARSFWYESQVKELLALVCFRPSGRGDEFFCSRQKRLTMDRVALTKEWIGAHLDEPVDLQTIADHVGCSPFYLSRTFSAETGFTITQYLRKCRIERAAELIATGRCNVSEAAVEVGYNSMSHFSKAFVKEKGCLPSRFEAA